MLDGSDVVVGLLERTSDQLVGFARAITDRTFLAIVLDVIVAPEFRGAGLGARLMDELLAARSWPRSTASSLSASRSSSPYTAASASATRLAVHC